MKKIIFIVFLTFFLANPPKALAQVSCAWRSEGGEEGCVPAANTCPAGYGPNYRDCWGRPRANCQREGRATCITEEQLLQYLQEDFPGTETSSEGPILKSIEHGSDFIPSSGIDFNALISGALPDFKFTNIGDVVSRFLLFAFPAAGILLLLYLVYGGFRLMTSGGDPKAVEAAKAKITTAVIGFVIIFAAYWIVQIVARVLGLQGITNIFQ